MTEVNPNLKIEIRPIPNRKGIREFSENLEYFSQATTIAPFVNSKTLKYETGLSEEDLKYLRKQGCPYNLDNNYKVGEPHEFWESPLVKVELLNTPIFLYPGKSILDFIKWKYLLVNNYIYKSETEMHSGSKPQATHYIYDESEEVEIRANKLERRMKLIKGIDNMSLDKKRKVLLLIEGDDTSTKSENYLSVMFDNVLNDKAKSAELENYLTEDSKVIDTKALIITGVYKNIIIKKKTGYFYFETNLGFELDDVVEFLNKTENQELLINLKNKINS